MDIFIAWSGDASNVLAEGIYRLLPFVIPEAKPFMSSESIRKGQRWFSEIGARLEKTNFAILCVTPQNLGSLWMHFEAGAAAKNTAQGHVSALLLDTAPADLQLPLSQFQHTAATKDEILKLFIAIDEASGTEKRRGAAYVKAVFDKFWPDLEQSIGKAREVLRAATKAPAPKRAEREILEGILDAQQGLLMRVAHVETQLTLLNTNALSFPNTPFITPTGVAAGGFGLVRPRGLLDLVPEGSQPLSELLAKFAPNADATASTPLTMATATPPQSTAPASTKPKA